MNKTLALSLTLMLGATAAFAHVSQHTSPDLSGKNAKELVEIVSGNSDAEMRTTAAYALMERREKSAFIPLLAALSDTSSPERLRSAVASDIFKMEDERAILVLLHTLHQPGLR